MLSTQKHSEKAQIRHYYLSMVDPVEMQHFSNTRQPKKLAKKDSM